VAAKSCIGNWLKATVLQLDWHAPWFAPWAKQGVAVLQAWQQHADLPSALNAQNPVVQFVPQATLPANTAYETFIFDQAQVPTRENAHDFFNGLCWLRFPQTKRRLNQLQAQAIARDGVQAQRGPLRDALTLFDENAAVLMATPALWQALQAKDWQALFVTHRADWAQAQLVLFGHASLEKLMQAYKGITVHVLNAPMPSLRSDAEIDNWLCQMLHEDWLQTKPFNPLPVMGIPAWWPANENPDFYTDKTVFRT
jgi:hypothetical protein